MTRAASSILLALLLALPAFATPSSQPQGIDERFFAAGGELDRAGGTDEPAAGEAVTLPSLTETSPGAEPDLVPGTLRVMGSLLLVSLLIVGIYKLGRKTKLPFFGGEGIVRRVATEPIGPNQFINIVEVADRMLVLGVSEKGITMLTELSGESRERVRLEKKAGTPGRSEKPTDFGRLFSTLAGLVKPDGRVPATAEARRGKGGRILAESLDRERRRIREAAL